jgi:Ti-type conjugative transfer relaxase TraA
MAIQFARVEIISRKAGGSAVGLSSYVSRSQRESQTTGRDYYFSHMEKDLVFHQIMLPQDAPEWAHDGEKLWNAAEAAEKRKDSQLAKHMVLALPKELSEVERAELTCQFVRQHFTDKGVAVEVAIHKPHQGEENWHAHLVISTRYLEAEGFTRKATELNPSFAKGKSGRAFVSEQDQWGEKWAAFQNLYFREKGLDLTVDAISLQPELHLKGSRFVEVSDKLIENEQRFFEAQALIKTDPASVLSVLTYHRAYFSERDVARYLFKAGLEGQEFEYAKVRILNKSIALYDRESGEETGYYTTKEIRESEKRIVESAGKLAQKNKHHVSQGTIEGVFSAYTLTHEQRGAFEAAIKGPDLVLWRGVAGAGKSYVLGALREAYTEEGYNVVGLAPTNTVARDMAAEGFEEARTLHSFLGRLERGTQSLDKNHLLLIDEAAMVSTKILEQVLKAASERGAKVLLIGDDRQLMSVERGGMFSILLEKHGAYELREVRRQSQDWAKEASLHFAEGKFREGLKAYAERGYLHWNKSLVDAKEALANQWEKNLQEDPHKIRFVYAQTNKEVNALNALLREKRQIRGELGEEQLFSSIRGDIMVATGERLQFYENDYKQAIFNGTCGTVKQIKGSSLKVMLDNGRQVTIDTETYQGFGHGYAGTVYRGQGKTQIETYYLHTPLAESKTSYVALTRHKEACHIYVAQETTRNLEHLAKQMSRQVQRGASLTYATHDEVANSREGTLSIQPERQGLQAKEIGGFKDLWQALRDWREGGQRLTEADQPLEKAAQALFKLDHERWEQAAGSSLVQEAFKKLTSAKHSLNADNTAHDHWLAEERKLYALEQNMALQQKKGKVVLPSEEQALKKQQDNYRKAFSAYVKEKPQFAGEEAYRIIERCEGQWRLRAEEEVRLSIAKNVLKEAVNLMKETRQWESFREKDSQQARQWQEIVKAQAQRSRQRGRGMDF